MIVLKLIAAINDSVNLQSLPHLNPTHGTEDALSRILTVVFIILAAVSVLFATIGGFRYVISQGNPDAVGKAKATILFSIIGLVVAIVAQTIVAFVLGHLG